jgi:Fe-S cluster assembly ATP-binding protein
MHKLQLKDYNVSIENKQILSNINLEIKTKEVHVIMGPNGVGKSSLCASIMGNPKFNTTGELIFDDKDISLLEVDEKARLGLFLAFQAPIEFDGLVISEYLKTALNARGIELPYIKFALELDKALKEVGLPSKYAFRYLNYGFSGGEKKKLETVSLKMLKPNFAFLDEIDSGLDVDAVKIVSENIKKEVENNDLGLVIITHSNKILEYITPTHVHVLLEGKIVKSGGIELAKKIEEEGFAWLKKD